MKKNDGQLDELSLKWPTIAKTAWPTIAKTAWPTIAKTASMVSQQAQWSIHIGLGNYNGFTMPINVILHSGQYSPAIFVSILFWRIDKIRQNKNSPNYNFIQLI